MRPGAFTAVALVAAGTLLAACAAGGRGTEGRPTTTGSEVPGTASVPSDTGTTAPIGTARSFSGSRTVGALFPPGGLEHTCTASVVDSATGNLLITAAHCIVGTAHGYRFAPGYHDGLEPFGSWTVVAAYGAPQWLSGRAAQSDYAFLVVAPRRVDGRSEHVQDVTGANRLGQAPASGVEVTVPAYPMGRDDDPITCTARVYYAGTYPAFSCNPYVGGTSGAPWLERSGRGFVVVGVIGGLHQGGCTPSISYSAAFSPATGRVARAAAAGVDPSRFPAAGSDGCSTGL
jgi:V8-like Glu-specific endopeptidase